MALAPPAPLPSWRRAAIVGALGLAVAGAAQASAAGLLAQQGDGPSIPIDSPARVGAWRRLEATGLSVPMDADGGVRVSYGKAGRRVDLTIAGSWADRKLPPLERLAQAPPWHVVEWRTLATADGDMAAMHLRRDDGRRLVWAWYWVGGRRIADQTLARLSRMMERWRDGDRAAAVVLATDDDDVAAADLADFLDAAAPLSTALTGSRPSRSWAATRP